MTNYKRLFQEQMKNPEFAKSYHEAMLERKIEEMLENLKAKISRNEPKEILLETINSFQKQI